MPVYRTLLQEHERQGPLAGVSLRPPFCQSIEMKGGHVVALPESLPRT